MKDTEETIAALDRGEVRVAEPHDDDWRVNEEVQAAIQRADEAALEDVLIHIATDTLEQVRARLGLS